MSGQRKLRPQAMGTEDRQFDALLRQAAQQFQQVSEDIRTPIKVSREGRHGGETNRRFAAYAAKA
jgi:hypothetical protein